MPRVHEGTATSWTFFFGVWTFEAGTVDFCLLPTLAIGVLRGRMGVVLHNSTLPGSAASLLSGKNVDEGGRKGGGEKIPK